jgi:hypothetical protein
MPAEQRVRGGICWTNLKSLPQICQIVSAGTRLNGQLMLLSQPEDRVARVSGALGNSASMCTHCAVTTGCLPEFRS